MRHRTPQPGNSPGFSLVAVLLLLALLVPLAVGLLSLASVSFSSSSARSARDEARANARLGMLVALGQIQQYLGPDTRVTANARLLDGNSGNPLWLGVWDTRTADGGLSFVDHHEDPKYLTDLRLDSAGAYERPQALSWLVSGSEFGTIGPEESASTTGSWVTIFDSTIDGNTVRVPKISIAEGLGGYGWWVSDESQKALVSHAFPGQDPPTDVNSSPEKFHRIAAAQAYQLSRYETSDGSRPIEETDLDLESDRSKLATLGSLRLWEPAANLSEAQLKDSFHDLTSLSRRLFTNTAEGGLKMDLTAFLERGDMVAFPDEQSIGLPSIGRKTQILPGSHHEKTSPRFGMLKGWWDQAFRMDAPSGEATLPTQNPSLLPSDPEFLPGLSRDLTNVDRPALQPVVVEISQGYDFSPYSKGEPGQEFLRSHAYPRVILWNPYNVRLRTERMIALIPVPVLIKMEARGELLNTMVTANFFMLEEGSLAEKFRLGYAIPPTVFAPGETKIFSPDPQASSGRKLYGKAAELDVKTYTNNVLTSENPPGIENFFTDSDVPVVAETDVNRYDAYGPSGFNSNHFYCPQYSERNFIVYEAPGSGPVDWDSLENLVKVVHFRTQNRGDGTYPKWYGGGNSLHPSNAGTFFREFKPGAPDIESLENRRPPRLWRRGVKMAWYDDTEQMNAHRVQMPTGRFTLPFAAAYNLRGGMVQHSEWLTVQKFSMGWDHCHMGSHYYFQLPTDPTEFENFYPPSPISKPSQAFPDRVVLFDLPRKSNGIVSLGQLQHAQLSYNNWHPSHVLGSSWSTANADLDATAIKERVGGGKNPWKDVPAELGDSVMTWDKLVQIGAGPDQHDHEVLIFDLGFEVNRAIWDRFMISSVPHTGESSERTPDWLPASPLPVSRYRYNPDSPLGPEEVEQRLDDDSFLFYHAAEFLVNRGGFNVNSTSVEAWKALLFALRGLQRPSLDGGESTGDNPFSRSLLPGTGGSDEGFGSSSRTAWAGFRALSDSEVETLANEIVEQVKLRGPFLSLADFINRRLVSDPLLARSGALESAIAATSINENLQLAHSAPTNLSDDKSYNVPEKLAAEMDTLPNRVDHKSVGLPGYFSQGDLLTALAPVITVRGDTFTIRSYGCARDDASGKPVAEAWCEAVVQRCPAYIDSGNPPVVPPSIANIDQSMSPNPELSSINRKFGRRFKVVSFRWLNHEEI